MFEPPSMRSYLGGQFNSIQFFSRTLTHMLKKEGIFIISALLTKKEVDNFKKHTSTPTLSYQWTMYLIDNSTNHFIFESIVEIDLLLIESGITLLCKLFWCNLDTDSYKAFLDSPKTSVKWLNSCWSNYLRTESSSISRCCHLFLHHM